MKFGDKLIVLRKKAGYSQEELAEKLGVSRQSVSKWESNNTYPETDKIIQICNLFECSMDDLINDKVIDVEGSMRKNKNNLNFMMDSFLEFITKTINMFSSMKFFSILRCLIEMIILASILFAIGVLVSHLVGYLLSNFFRFLPYRVMGNIREIITNICYVLWFIVSIIVFLHTFKIRYLDYYDQAMKEVEEKEETEEKEKFSKNTVEFHEKEKPTIIIRDEKHRPFAFLSIFSKIIIWIFKFFVFWLFVITAFTVLGFLIGDFFLLSMFSWHSIFIGIFLICLSLTVVTSQIAFLLIQFLIEKKSSWMIHLIIFFTSLFLCAIGMAYSMVSFQEIEIKEENNEYQDLVSITIPYDERLILDKGHSTEYVFIVDDSIGENEVRVSQTTNRWIRFSSWCYEEYGMNVCHIGENVGKPKEWIQMVKKSFQKNEILIPKEENTNPIEIRATSLNIDHLIENMKKMYLLEESGEENHKILHIHDFRVLMQGSSGRSNYSVYQDTLEVSNRMECEESKKETKWGVQKIISCEWKSDEWDDE